jgi:hypothetical protein
MDFNDARVGIEILEKYSCGQNCDWGSEENRKKPITGNFEFGHDQCWITMFRTTSNPELTDDERKRLEDAKWFFDEENNAWSHY